MATTPWTEPPEEDPHADVRQEGIRAVNRLLVVVLCLAVLLGANIVYTAITTSDVAQRVTVLEQSPCTEAAKSERDFSRTVAGRQCNKARRAIVRHEALQNQCLIFQRVTGRTPEQCEKFQGGAAGGTGQPGTQGGDSQQTGTTPSQQPAPGDGGSTGGSGDTGGESPPSDPPSDPNPPAPNPSPQPQSDPDVEIDAPPVHIGADVPCVDTGLGVQVGC